MMPFYLFCTVSVAFAAVVVLMNKRYGNQPQTQTVYAPYTPPLSTCVEWGHGGRKVWCPKPTCPTNQ